MVADVREQLQKDFRKKEMEMNKFFQDQKAMLDKELKHYKNKCVQVQDTMRNNSADERTRMALQMREQRKDIFAERLGRAALKLKMEAQERDAAEEPQVVGLLV